ncbi:response regulator transcription factor [Desulfitobacterium hafniense]|uniref:Stage 0 sporulation protein A homolog n=2 Tax=Desulfitobacterium hafniense TaxID=49338 RepID=Q251C7_DESHY|nr:response regulator transcription factor [Desulfitobacterium hafniense]KTE91549.1 two-component system response regulator [Desulfitobacterium hafniense]BAE82115.1 hypothetical protein DSY0326 [Desulfitobacterium hafniense Y51]
MKIMLVDDEPSLCSALEIVITRAGYDFYCATDGIAALELFRSKKPDLAILDLMVPWLNGFEICEEIRRTDSHIPILILSAKGDIVDKKMGFRAGADDYLTKPFEEEELLLRIEALLRRRNKESGSLPINGLSQKVEIGELIIDPFRYEVTVRDRLVNLTPKEYQIIALMANHPGKVFTREDLIDCIWGKEFETGSISIPVYIRRIREKIEQDPSEPTLLKTVWRFGYKLGD